MSQAQQTITQPQALYPSPFQSYTKQCQMPASGNTQSTLPASVLSGNAPTGETSKNTDCSAWCKYHHNTSSISSLIPSQETVEKLKTNLHNLYESAYTYLRINPHITACTTYLVATAVIPKINTMFKNYTGSTSSNMNDKLWTPLACMTGMSLVANIAVGLYHIGNEPNHKSFGEVWESNVPMGLGLSAGSFTYLMNYVNRNTYYEK